MANGIGLEPRAETDAALDRLVRDLLARPRERRTVVAVAGAPGSGKSTLAETLKARLDAAAPGLSQVLPMDGFHYDDQLLEARGWRPRKGAPFTFDIDGLASALDRLRRDDGREVAVPVFDRALEIARAGARLIGAEARLVIVEGNYLLLDDPAWAGLRQRFDVTVRLDVPLPTLEARLRARWAGFGYDEAAIHAKLEENDLPNARLVATRSVAADVVVANTGPDEAR
ncbi:nucleoside/nucleotide kinase family protein [Ancylobacter sp. Lp-2]|uniref:nucleoside/nucleotide kinase family protein n=1 Tax=Ancylobacter sp. Lp-2 TaxID=2881339 RepID=UPI001E493CEE|nr:nucleoside/nucleotide kinase family protein [Ancylobacter sp. Lp-2]MCB4770985.1 nucleoside/nucleotide kinase family protein [Ancylobacter sp. Lp-2]